MNKHGHHRQFLFLIGCFLKKYSPLLKERYKMRNVNGRRTPSDGKSSHCLWQGELKKNKQIKMFWNGFQHFYQVKTV
jgi:hypothetical protein